jgi:hypothetical protein
MASVSPLDVLNSTTYVPSGFGPKIMIRFFAVSIICPDSCGRVFISTTLLIAAPRLPKKLLQLHSARPRGFAGASCQPRLLPRVFPSPPWSRWQRRTDPRHSSRRKSRRAARTNLAIGTPSSYVQRSQAPLAQRLCQRRDAHHRMSSVESVPILELRTHARRRPGLRTC